MTIIFSAREIVEKLLILPISSLHSKFYPQHINHMPAVKFQMCLDFEQISADFELSNFSRYPLFKD